MAYSSSIPVTSGVVAGSVLGPILLAIVIDSFAFELDDNTTMVKCLQMTSKYRLMCTNWIKLKLDELSHTKLVYN